MQVKYIIGLMSGTSLDGLDVAFCKFWEENNQFQFEILDTHFQNYPLELLQSLKNAKKTTSEVLCKLDYDYGKWLGKSVLYAIQTKGWKADAIASHGYTVFHNPDNGYTYQIGRGSAISSVCKIPVICDFRSLDVSLGGQGAPLVSIGDLHLFAKYESCLNLGGIANISFRKNNTIQAFDICPFNIVLNHFSEKLGYPYDKSGQMSAQGRYDELTLKKLNQHDFFSKIPPKSLGAEIIEQDFIPILSTLPNPKDSLRTAVELSAIQIAKTLDTNSLQSCLITGGGTYNSYFLERLENLTSCKIIIPDKKIIEYKEALIFAFLGYLRLLEKENILKEVTGASRNSVGACIYHY